MSRHILVIPSWYSDGRGSGGGYFRDQALALKAAGHRVAILAPGIYTRRDLRSDRIRAQRQSGAITVEIDGVPVYRREAFTVLPRFPYRNPLVWSRCGLALAQSYIAENGQPDLVHAHSCLHAGVLALALKRRHGIRYLVSEHSTGFAQDRLRWWERDLVRRVVNHAHRCIAVSPDLAELLHEQYPGSSWAYVPNILGETFLNAKIPDRHLAADSPFIFLCVARLSPQKACDLLIEAFARAFCECPEVRLRVVGDGPLRCELEQLSSRLGIAPQIDFVGSLPPDGVREEMQAADAFVLASEYETFGVVVIEALACGLPVVCTASGGPDHLIQEQNGLLVRNGDVTGLRDALLQMRSRAWAYDLAAIRADAVARYGPETFARQFEALIC